MLKRRLDPLEIAPGPAPSSLRSASRWTSLWQRLRRKLLRVPPPEPTLPPFEGLLSQESAFVWRYDLSSRQFTYLSYRESSLCGYPVDDWFQPGFWAQSLAPHEAAVRELLSRTSSWPTFLSFDFVFADGLIRRARDFILEGPQSEQPVATGVRIFSDSTLSSLPEISTVRMEALATFARGLAHNVNDVLTTIMGQVHRLEREEDAQEAIQKISSATRQAQKLTRQLLAFGREGSVCPRLVEINQRFRDLKPVIESTLGARVSVDYQLSGEPLPILADPGQLESMILNLVRNSREAMPQGGRFYVRTRPVQHYAEVMIEDSGEGIAPDDLPRIFEPYFTTKKYAVGAGLGLSMVYGTVKQLRGKISVTSADGEGARFILTLPIAPSASTDSQNADREVTAPPPQPHGPVEPLPTEPKSPFGKRTILVCEDTTEVREVIRSLLEREGYDVLIAQDGAHGLLLAGQSSRGIDLLLTDIMMPGVTGPEIASQLDAQYPEVAVLYMSGLSRVVLKAQLGVTTLDLTPRNFIEKPFQPAELLAKIATLLDVVPRA